MIVKITKKGDKTCKSGKSGKSTKKQSVQKNKSVSKGSRKNINLRRRTSILIGGVKPNIKPKKRIRPIKWLRKHLGLRSGSAKITPISSEYSVPGPPTKNTWIYGPTKEFNTQGLNVHSAMYPPSPSPSPSPSPPHSPPHELHGQHEQPESHASLELHKPTYEPPQDTEISKHMDTFMNRHKNLFNYSDLVKGIVSDLHMSYTSDPKTKVENEEMYKQKLHEHLKEIFTQNPVGLDGTNIDLSPHSIEQIIHNEMIDKILSPTGKSRYSQDSKDSNERISPSTLLEMHVIGNYLKKIRDDRYNNNKERTLYASKGNLRNLIFNIPPDFYNNNDTLRNAIHTLTTHKDNTIVNALKEKTFHDMEKGIQQLINEHFKNNKGLTIENVDKIVKSGKSLPDLPDMTKDELIKFRQLRDNSNKDNNKALSTFIDEIRTRNITLNKVKKTYETLKEYLQKNRAVENLTVENYLKTLSIQETHKDYNQYKDLVVNIDLLKLNLLPANASINRIPNMTKEEFIIFRELRDNINKDNINKDNSNALSKFLEAIYARNDTLLEEVQGQRNALTDWLKKNSTGKITVEKYIATNPINEEHPLYDTHKDFKTNMELLKNKLLPAIK